MPEPAALSSAARRLVLVSGVFLVLQVAATDYGPENDGPAAFGWLLIGAVLLWFVLRRHSRVARGIVVVLSLVGAVIFALAALDDVHHLLLVTLYLGQALPLLARPVREWVQTERHDPTTGHISPDRVDAQVSSGRND